LCAVQQNTFQNWKKLFGAVYKQWRGVLWRRQVILSCKLINTCF
jgi:hypothetical protein